MTIGEELNKLDQLRRRGVLSEEGFTRAKARVLEGHAGMPLVTAINAFRRSTSDCWIGGVCGGIADSTGLSAAASVCPSTSCCGYWSQANDTPSRATFRLTAPAGARCVARDSPLTISVVIPTTAFDFLQITLFRTRKSPP
jgi:hypothetical protein